MKLYQMIDIFDEHKNFRCCLLFCSAFVSFLKSNRLKSIRIGYSAAFQNKEGNPEHRHGPFLFDQDFLAN